MNLKRMKEDPEYKMNYIKKMKERQKEDFLNIKPFIKAEDIPELPKVGIHVMIKIPNRQSYIDRRGFTNGLFYRIMPYKVRTVSIEELEKLVDDKSLWRKKFDRSLESEIRKIIS